MSYSKQAHELLEASFQMLKEKKGDVAWPFMVGLLMPNVRLEDAQRIAKMISEMEKDK